MLEQQRHGGLMLAEGGKEKRRAAVGRARRVDRLARTEQLPDAIRIARGRRIKQGVRFVCHRKIR